MVKISIVIAYYNRYKLLKRTIKSIYQSKYTDFEIIIVNDGSNDECALDELVNEYNPKCIKNINVSINDIKSKNKLNKILSKYKSKNIKLINIDKNDKKGRTNPSVPFNIGIKNAKGEIIIIQNPESYHNGDIITYVSQNLNKNNYLVFSAYNLQTNEANKIFKKLKQKTLNNLKKIPRIYDELEWYQHPIHRNVKYHFCSAIYKSNLDIVGGFDEEYAKGVCYDDCDLVFKIEQVSKLNIKSLSPEEAPYIVNMYHTPSASTGIDKENDNNLIKRKWLKNKNYFTNKINSININFLYPRIVHLIWHGPLPFLNYLTLLSFHKYHPAWVINVYRSNTASTDNKWNTGEQKQFKNNIKDYYPYIEKLKYINIINIDNITKKLGIDNIYMVHQSDIMRMYLLSEYGGVYSDFDIIYTNNIEKYFLNKTTTLVFDRISRNKNIRYFPNAFFVANKNCEYCKFVVKEQLKYVNTKVDGYNNVGPEMIKDISTLPKYENFRKNIEILDSACYLPLEWNELDKIYGNVNFQNNNYFSIHWFNGAAQSKDYIDNFEINNFKINCKMDMLIKKYIGDLKLCN